ncbi:putative mycofactocin binding protein MftB [Streptomyces sp. V4I23]|uniref:mycofactocin biosynthesis chaperone MftB n=1 Tax=Streptomyces sp. V4I23 TaxID=3042282 RepID=UPI002783668A|nr:mycofactocin biosynthesis chaperone MftB [Streptomyces sp. V4I23]MDQ1012115.1 putative mycofactocin binding protein MftB [Streptomyces sp. V4I23]
MLDPDRPYRCSPSVALRPETFGALAYHFGTRRLSFLKTPALVELVTTLDEYADIRTALTASLIPTAEHGVYLAALDALADAGTIEPR